ncbi:MAG: hypothetical protein WDZ53_06095 [Balneolales bacterium]
MKVSYCFQQDNPATREVAGSMGRAQTLFSHQDCQTIPFSSGSFSFVTAGERYSSIPMVRFGKNGNHLVVTGLPITHRGSLETRLNNIVHSDYYTAGKLIAGLEGAFALTHWDEINKKLLIATDCLGMQPLYMVHKKGLFLLGSEIKALAASGCIDIVPDLAGWGSFLSTGYTLGNGTMLAGAERIPSATLMVYDPVANNIRKETYWKWPLTPVIDNIDKAPTADIVELLMEDVHGYTEHYPEGYMLLSGGFDSRLIAYLLDRENIPFQALVVKHHDEAANADGRFARKVARLLDIDSSYIKSSRSYYSSPEYLNYVIMNDMATESLYLFIAQVSACIRQEMKAVWDGAFPGRSLKATFPPGGFGPFIDSEFSFKDSLKWKAASTVFAPHMLNGMYEGFIDALNREKGKQPDSDEGVSRFLVNNRLRNRTAMNPLKVYANHVLPFTPGLNKEYWRITSSISYKAKAPYNLYLKILGRHFPGSLQAPVMTGSQMISQKPWPDRDVYRSILQKIAGPRLSGKMGIQFLWEPSKLVDVLVSSVDSGHPDLNSDGIEALKKNMNGSYLSRTACNQLFYWQAWQAIMSGKLSTRRRQGTGRTNYAEG